MSKIAEMTGRKWRFVTGPDGTTRRETRAEIGMSQDQVHMALASALHGALPSVLPSALLWTRST